MQHVRHAARSSQPGRRSFFGRWWGSLQTACRDLQRPGELGLARQQHAQLGAQQWLRYEQRVSCVSEWEFLGAHSLPPPSPPLARTATRESPERETLH